MMRRILLPLLMFLGTVGCSGFLSRDTVAVNKRLFVGRWKPTNPGTHGIVRVDVREATNTLFVHEWGKCSPSDCDWGETQARGLGDKISVKWIFAFAEESQQLTLDHEGVLKLLVRRRYTDRSGRADVTETSYFVKVPLEH